MFSRGCPDADADEAERDTPPTPPTPWYMALAFLSCLRIDPSTNRSTRRAPTSLHGAMPTAASTTGGGIMRALDASDRTTK